MKRNSHYLLGLLFFSATQVLADGSSIGKVYSPYVYQYEREIEWRLRDDGQQQQQLGLGMALSDRFFIEAYLITDVALTLEAYELEMKWQLTEQGEYNFDWGLLTELEKEAKDDIWEWSTHLLVERQWGRWISKANLGITYEWGRDIENEIETSLSVQTRYRLSAKFEPALEFHLAEQTKALGPVLMGDIRLTDRKKIHWETGALLGLNSETADTTWRLLMAFEF